MKYLVIGFNDVKTYGDKQHGNAVNTYFSPDDCFECEKLPEQKELWAYALQKQYYPSRKPGCVGTKCEVLYKEIHE